MTCIVAVEDAGAVVVGCDAFMGSDVERDLTDRPKWWRHGRALVAFAATFTIAQIAETSRVRVPSKRELPRSYALHLARVWRGACAAVTRDEPALLVALDGEAWVIQSDWSVVRSQHGYAALGYGAANALGALAATEGRTLEERARWGLTSEERVRIALAAAARHTTQVSAPFHTTRVG